MAVVEFPACRKFVEVSPPSTSLVSTNVYTSDPSASSAMLGLYNSISAQGRFATQFDVYAGLQADELTNYNPSNATYQEFYTNSLMSTNPQFWSELYNDIFVANSILTGVEGSSSLSPAVKSQLIGESKFMRAFFYFYMVNLWGPVPLVTSASDYQANNSAFRTSRDSVYAQIEADLEAAKGLLSPVFVGADSKTVSAERTRPTKWAAGALLARVYLFEGKWLEAEMESDTVVDNTSMFSLLPDLTQIFLANSNEAIWQLQPVTPDYNTVQAYNYILTTDPGTGTAYVTMSDKLREIFDSADLRLSNWVGIYTDGTQSWYYPFKYKVNTGASSLSEYLMVLRLAEQYLIRSEARAEQNKIDGVGGAVADLNTIRIRAGVQVYPAGLSQNTVLEAVMQERQKELFTEWGHRWMDLVRTTAVDTVLGPPGNYLQVKGGGSWNPKDSLYPLPLSDLMIDGNLIQNPGYQ
jgi:starch-binding outer membrane protein, SusD/RagB family